MARVRKPKGSRFVHRGQTGKRAKGGLRRAFLLEGLEARELLSFDAHVNFQPAGRPVPNGYVADTGDAFGQRSGGLQFGWDKSGIDIFDRWTSADDLHDTTAAMQWQGNYTWEMAVPSGTYKVHLSAGDANSWNDLQKINVEGVTVVNAVTTQDQRWVEGTATVTVTDGRLTVTSPSTTSRNAIDFIDVTWSDGATPPPVVPPPPVTPPPVTPPPVSPPPTDPPPPPATGSTIKVNFQPAGLPVVPGYLPDVGQLYGNRGNGAEYGWTTSGINLFDRWANPDPLRDHFAAMQWQGNYTWEIGLANGTYQVHIVSGDANSWNETMRITAEGQAVVNATTTAGNRWVEGTATVTVSDGRLTIGNATGATSNNINYIEITPTSGGGTTTPTTNPTTPTTPTNPTPPPTTPTQPGAAVVGTNIDGLADWATVSPLIDITSQFRQWGNITKTYEADPNLPLTADNYPLVDAGSISYVYGYPDGRYKVSYDGIGSLAFSGMNAKYTVVFHTGDHWGGYLDITPQTSKGAILEIRLTGINPANPVHNLHILSPDADPAVSDTFRPVFLKKLMPFNGPLRVMDWMQTNDTPAANWQDRTKTTRFSYTNDTGVPYETIAKLANTLNKDLWINVPYHATEDYVRQMARFFRDNVNPNLHIYVEYSNEVWNSGFEQMRANQAAAWADNSLTKTDDFGRQAQKFGRLTGRAAQIFKEEFGAAYASRVRFELGGLIAGSYWAQTALQQIQSSYGDPKSLLYGIAVAPYVGVQGDMDAIDNASLTMQGLFDWMNNWIDGPITTWTRDHKRLADAYGLKLDSYEGGQSLSYINGKNEALKISAQDDARMGLMYQHLITTWTKESGGGVFGNFALATQKGPWGSWGVLESIDQPTSVKYQAVTSMAGKVV